MSSGGAPVRPYSERALDCVCWVFAIWTMACHAAVVTGASLWVAGVLFALLLAGTAAWRVRHPAAREADLADPAPVAPPADLPLRGLAVMAAGALVWLWSSQALAFWWGVAVFLASLLALSLWRDAVEGVAARPAVRDEIALGVLALACAALALVAHRPDLDDAFYLNLAVAAADAPGAALLANDTLHGVDGLPIHHPIYRVHSWELWNALVARLGGISVIGAFHFVHAAVAAFLVPLAWAGLFRRIAPRAWLAAVFAVVVVLIALGAQHRGYANFAFVRIWQGKAILVSAVLPYIASLAIDLARAPSRARTLRLALAQIAALGLSSTALWAAPVTAVCAAASALQPSRAALRTLGLVLLACGYVLCAGLVMRAALAADLGERRAAVESDELRAHVAEADARRAERHRPGAQLEQALQAVMGEGAGRPLVLVAWLMGCALAPAGVGRRYASAASLAVWLTLFNPYATELVTRGVVGNSYWRVLWVLPVPALCALALVAPLVWVPRRGVALALSASLCLGFVRLAAPSALAPGNDVQLAVPDYKVPHDAYRAAELFAERVPAGAVVVAPRPVAAWLPTFAERAAPLLVREPYLRRYRNALGNDDLYHRVVMTDYVSGIRSTADATRHFERGLERYGVSGVLLAVTADAAQARTVLRDAGFVKLLATLDYEIWVREAA